jgi:AcrR family transcriptional regulator
MQIVKKEIESRIIDSAITEFSRCGYEKASMRNIAKSAETSVSNTYNYFKNKEQLFTKIIGPVYEFVKNMAAQTVENNSGRGLQGDDILAFTRSISDNLLKMNERQRLLLVILAEKSQGTKYEKSKEEFTMVIKLHIAEAIASLGNQNTPQHNQDYILGIIAANYVDGLFNILKDFRSRQWAEENIRVLLTYHLNGIKALM